MRDTPLSVVHAWQFGQVGVTGIAGRLPAVGGELGEFRDAAAEVLEATLREAIPDEGGVRIQRRVVEGRGRLGPHQRIAWRRATRGRFPRARRLLRIAAGFSEPAMRSARRLPG